MTEKQKAFQKIIVDRLTQDGYRPEFDTEGDIKFKKEGRLYWFIFYGEDEDFVQLAYPNFWKLENAEERGKAYIACNAANAAFKTVKISVLKDGTNVWATSESFIKSIEPFIETFERTLSAIVSGVRKFKEVMEADEPKSDLKP